MVGLLPFRRRQIAALNDRDGQSQRLEELAAALYGLGAHAELQSDRLMGGRDAAACGLVCGLPVGVGDAEQRVRSDLRPSSCLFALGGCEGVQYGVEPALG